MTRYTVFLEFFLVPLKCAGRGDFKV